MKSVLLFLLNSVFCMVYSQTLTWQWANSNLGAGSDGANSITTDAFGNVLVTGVFYGGTITFGTYTLTNNGNYDMFVTKYDPSGNVIWAQSSGGLYDDLATGIATDASGNVILTGQFTSPTISFGTYTLNNSGVTDIFVVKYDNAGNVLWAKNEGGTNSDEGNAVCTDPLGNIFIAGQYQSSSMVAGTYTLNNSGIGDIFLIKYDSAGNVTWAQSAGGNQSDVAYCLTAGNNGDVFLGGSFKSASIAFGSNTLNNVSSGYTDIFVTRYDGAGSVQWAKSAGGIFDEVACGITTDPSGNVLVTGSFKSSSVQFGSYTLTNAATTSCDVFTVKYDFVGNELWAKGEGGNLDDIAYGIASDPGGNVFITGHVHSSSITFGTTTYTTVGVGDLFLLQYTSAGNVGWSTTVGGPSDEGTSSICTDTNGNVYITGFFYSSVMNFGSQAIMNSGSADVFVAKMSGVTGTENNVYLFASELLLYPNPSSGKFKIKHANDKISRVEIISLDGKQIYSSDQIYFDSEIDLTDKSKGIYLVSINTERGIFRCKLVLD